METRCSKVVGSESGDIKDLGPEMLKRSNEDTVRDWEAML